MAYLNVVLAIERYLVYTCLISHKQEAAAIRLELFAIRFPRAPTPEVAGGAASVA
jgi:hypothetical protein